jgi:hypothetical protein
VWRRSLSTICGLSEKSLLKGMIVGAIGSDVGDRRDASIEGVESLTFGATDLLQGGAPEPAVVEPRGARLKKCRARRTGRPRSKPLTSLYRPIWPPVISMTRRYNWPDTVSRDRSPSDHSGLTDRFLDAFYVGQAIAARLASLTQ